MSKLTHIEFTEFSSDYLFCSDPNSASDITCVIVEDEPGPYLDFIQDLVKSGACSTAMSVPFSDKTIQLLLGNEVTFGDEDEQATVRLHNPRHCALILDMRNTEGQTFAGYDKNQFELCGYQFFKQLRGFPGKVFFATRYGRELLEAQGITGAFGVVPLEMKADYHAPMPETDKQKLLAALNLALVQCDVSDVYRIALRGDAIDITFRGEVCSLARGKDGPKKSGLAFMSLVQAGPKGLTDEELADRIGYQARPDEIQDESVDDESGKAKATGEMSAEELLPRLLDVVKEGHLPGVDYQSLCRRLGMDIGSRVGPDAEEVFRDAFALSQDASSDFTINELCQILRGEICPSNESVLDARQLDDGYDVTCNPDAPQHVTAQIKALHIREFVQSQFSEIPRRQAEIEELTAQVHLMRADGFRKVAKAADDGKVEDAIQEKDELRDRAAAGKARIQELEKELKQLRTLRDQSYRIMRSRCVDGQYQPITKPGPIADYMSRLPRRLVRDLEKDCKPTPQALIKYISGCWVRQSGAHRYIGKETWRVG